MQQTNRTETASPETPAIAVGMAEASRISGLSKRTIEYRIAAGRLRAVKCGTKTLVMVDSIRADLESLPPATFRNRMVTKAA